MSKKLGGFYKTTERKEVQNMKIKEKIKNINQKIAAVGLFLSGIIVGTTIVATVSAQRETDKVLEIAKARGLNPDNIEAALKTYHPTGMKDEYIMFSSGGHSGQVIVIGIPSMRILKYIAVFTPEPWQGWGYDDENIEILRGDLCDPQRAKLTWADTHHPAISETNGDYDGQFLFIGDKANSRLAVISLKDFETKQIVCNPLGNSNHGAAFVTPNSEYIIEPSQYAVPQGGRYAPIDKYAEQFRGYITFWAFDRAKGRIDTEKSFAVEVPPYWQDLCDAGKGPSYGYAFCNSFNSEMATGRKTLDSKEPPLEVGVSANDMDYLHIINWKKAEELVKAGKHKEVVGVGGFKFKVIPLDVAAKERILVFTPEPKSPHGVDVSPNGKWIVVGGKLDTNVSVYSIEKIKKATEANKFEKTDRYGVPIIAFKDALEAQVQIGLGPLHTVFDDKGFAYTSVFIESVVAKWKLEEWKLVEKLPVHYNIGHIAAAEGDTVAPDGKYVIALNKWSIDRFSPVGPLHPQNFQLIDISGPKMKLLYDMPIPLGEPHYAQVIKADKLSPWLVYPEVGFSPAKMKKSAHAVEFGKEKIVRKENKVEIYMTAIRSRFTPEIIEVNQGDEVTFYITNVERAREATHGFALGGYNVNISIEPGETGSFTIKADMPGVFPFYCSEFCSALHLEMAGYLLVKPKK
ncbi:MAG: Sec-dependent nitrous-oxide reductase [bacterium]|nr:Sec-dependent nitrous-oxide reductase [bacterium]